MRAAADLHISKGLHVKTIEAMRSSNLIQSDENCIGYTKLMLKLLRMLVYNCVDGPNYSQTFPSDE